MTTSASRRDPQPGLGLAAVTLGTVGLLLFFLPVLGVPLAAAGLCFGLIGLLLALRGWTSWRWALAGIAVAGLALAVGLAIDRAPAGFLPHRIVPLDLTPVPKRPFVPPPATGPGD
jgi:hypothetical protein